MTRRVGTLLGVAAIVCGALAVPVLADGFGLSSPDATTVPERTVEVRDRTHTVDATIVADSGEAVTVDIEAPAEEYRVNVYNGDQELVASRSGEDAGTYTYDLAGYEPGSYAVTLLQVENGTVEALLPLLVRGYDVETSAPRTVDDDALFEVAVDVTATDADGDPPTVEAVLASGSTDRRVEAVADGGQYRATVDASTLDVGEYSVYGVVRGEDEAFGRNELLGFDRAGILTVQRADDGENGDDSDGDDSDGDDGSGGDGESGDGSGDDGSDGSDDETDGNGAGGGAGGESGGEDADGGTTETATPSPTPTTTPPSSPQDGPTATAAGPTPTATPSETGATDDSDTGGNDGVITPNGSSGADTEAPGTTGPGFSLWQVGVVLALLGVLVARRRGS